MTRPNPSRPTRLPHRACALVLAALCGGSVLAPFARAAAPDAAELSMPQEAQPMRAAADTFIAHAMAGQAERAAAMLSPALLARIGHEAAANVMRTQILPFFQRGGAVGRSTTVTRTTDASGNTGFAFYLWLDAREPGEPARPFTLYMVREQGRVVVANVVPDRLVAGRHP